MNDLIRLIHQHGGTVEFRSGADGFGPCGVPPEYLPAGHPDWPFPPAVAEVTSVDLVEVHPCADCLTRVIETVMTKASDAGDHNPRITVMISRTVLVTGTGSAA